MQNLTMAIFISFSILIILCLIHPILGLSFPRKSPGSRQRRPSADLSSPTENCRCTFEETFDIGISTGVFKSPGFPNRYCNNLNCNWNIAPMEDSFVGAMLDYFETEHRFDVLEVYQTQWNGSTLMEAKQTMLHGSFDPRTMERQFFSSVGRGLKFRLLTDGTDSDFHGFQISFRRYPKDDRTMAPCPPPFQFATSEVQLLPPLAPKFRIDSSCIFVINSTEAVKLTINQFRSSNLALKVYETENYQVFSMLERPLFKIQPGILPELPVSFSSRTPSMTILLSTQQNPFNNLDQSRNRGSLASGGQSSLYEIKFEATKSLCACPPATLVISREHASTLTSPGFPLEYCDAANCTVNVSLEGPQAKARKVLEGIRLTFEAFETEPDMDYLEFYDQNTGQKMLSLSHEAKNIHHLTFDMSRITMSFITDHSIVETGFNLTVEAFSKPIECICPESPQAHFDFRSHHEENRFDYKKCHFLDCFWLISPPKSIDPNAYHRLLLKINHTLSWVQDFILVNQGPQRERNPFSRKITALSSGAEISDEYEGPVPVRIWLHREFDFPTMDESDPPLEFNFSYEWREVCQCGQDKLLAFSDKWQTLSSPDYPSTYCRSMRCQWRLEAPAGHHLSLNITDFTTEPDQDFLYIFDGNDTTLPHKEMLSGTLYRSTTVHGRQPVMTLLFISDPSIQAKGFQILYRAEPDPGTLASLSSTSGGFPKSLVFFLFLVLAGTGALFLISRSSNQQFGGAWHAFAVNPIAEGRVIFARRTGRQHASSADLSASDLSSPHEDPSTSSNPLFHFRLP